MDIRFATIVADLPSLLDQLLACPVHTGGTVPPRDVPLRGVYLFSEGDDYLYVGRTDKLRRRYVQHCRNRHNDAPFAFKLARGTSGNLKAKGGLTRKALEADPVFSQHFRDAKLRVSQMAFRWVAIGDPNQQCLFEIYATIALNARHNDFENH